jgi:hypothetical protein
MIGADLQGVQVWVATTPVDMRKSFDSLAEVVRYKRLARGVFLFPRGSTTAVEISCAELLRLLSGMKLSSRQPG